MSLSFNKLLVIKNEIHIVYIVMETEMRDTCCTMRPILELYSRLFSTFQYYTIVPLDYKHILAVV